MLIRIKNFIKLLHVALYIHVAYDAAAIEDGRNPSALNFHAEVHMPKKTRNMSPNSTSSSRSSSTHHVLSLQEYNEYWARSIAQMTTGCQQDIVSIIQLEETLRKDTAIDRNTSYQTQSS